MMGRLATTKKVDELRARPNRSRATRRSVQKQLQSARLLACSRRHSTARARCARRRRRRRRRSREAPAIVRSSRLHRSQPSSRGTTTTSRHSFDDVDSRSRARSFARSPVRLPPRCRHRRAKNRFEASVVITTTRAVAAAASHAHSSGRARAIVNSQKINLLDRKISTSRHALMPPNRTTDDDDNNKRRRLCDGDAAGLRARARARRQADCTWRRASSSSPPLVAACTRPTIFGDTAAVDRCRASSASSSCGGRWYGDGGQRRASARVLGARLVTSAAHPVVSRLERRLWSTIVTRRQPRS